MANNESPSLVNFVCTANICRSPMAEYLFRAQLEKKAAVDPKWRRLQAVSSGVSASDGDPISLNSLEALKALGIDASAHRSRFLTQDLLNRSLAVFCMTSTHKLLIEMRYSTRKGQVHLLRDFIKGKVSREVPDPYGAGLEDYMLCRDQIAQALPGVFEYLEKLL